MRAAKSFKALVTVQALCLGAQMKGVSFSRMFFNILPCILIKKKKIRKKNHLFERSMYSGGFYLTSMSSGGTVQDFLCPSNDLAGAIVFCGILSQSRAFQQQGVHSFHQQIHSNSLLCARPCDRRRFPVSIMVSHNACVSSQHAAHLTYTQCCLSSLSS